VIQPEFVDKLKNRDPASSAASQSHLNGERGRSQGEAKPEEGCVFYLAIIIDNRVEKKQ